MVYGAICSAASSGSPQKPSIRNSAWSVLEEVERVRSVGACTKMFRGASPRVRSKARDFGRASYSERLHQNSQLQLCEPLHGLCNPESLRAAAMYPESRYDRDITLGYPHLGQYRARKLSDSMPVLSG